MTDINNTDIQTILKNIGPAKQIAVVLPQQVNLDLLSAAVALYEAISGPEKSVIILCSTREAMPRLPFIKTMPPVLQAINTGNQLAIKVSNQHAQPKELRYEKSDDGLTVFITPGEGKFETNDVTVLPSTSKLDLIIILGAVNLEQLGSIYTENAQLFFNTPHINIDVNPANEFYGTMNFVQTVASSVSEVVTDLVEAMPNVLTNDTVSTALLAGIISQTSSFRDPKTTPQALLKASHLIEAGARRQDIIQYLFKTKPLPLLQLWGRALARLSALPEKQTLTAVVTKSDLEKTGVQADMLPIVVQDIIEMITGYSLVALMAELPSGGTHLILAGLPFEDLPKLVNELAPSSESGKPLPLTGKYNYLSFHIDKPLAETQEAFSKMIENRKSVV